MKEKRILAMFITSAVTLVASLAVTFGVLTTLATPVEATGILTYEFNIGGKNGSQILTTDNGYALSTITFNPSSGVEWSDDSVVYFDEGFDAKIMFDSVSLSSRIKVVPFKINNTNTETGVELELRVNREGSNALLNNTYMKLYDFETGKFTNFNGSRSLLLNPSTSVEYALVVFADDTYNTTGEQVQWNTDTVLLNIQVNVLNDGSL